ncbi:hypothetical protein PsorP6_018951 [Peronosclerospora sorghi]|nr:hypothetical protein PsorP6_018951 [Peronosclerospora sorghi]
MGGVQRGDLGKQHRKCVIGSEREERGSRRIDFSQAKHGAQVAVGEAVRVAEFGDEKLGVSNRAGGVVQNIVELDERLGVSATAAKVDSKVTGGLGNKVAATTVGSMSESVNYISKTLHNVKLTAQQSTVAQNF